MTPFDLLSLIIVYVIVTISIGWLTDKFIDDGTNVPDDLLVLFPIGFCTEIALAVIIFVLYCFYNVGMMAFNWII